MYYITGHKYYFKIFIEKKNNYQYNKFKPRKIKNLKKNKLVILVIKSAHFLCIFALGYHTLNYNISFRYFPPCLKNL